MFNLKPGIIHSQLTDPEFQSIDFVSSASCIPDA